MVDRQLAQMDINQLNKVISQQQIAMGKITQSNNQHVKILQSIETQQLNAIRRFTLECRQKIDIARATQKKNKEMNDLIYAVHQSLLETAIAAKEEQSKNQQQSPFRFQGKNNHGNVAILGIRNLDCDTNESPLIKEENEHESPLIIYGQPPPQQMQYQQVYIHSV